MNEIGYIKAFRKIEEDPIICKDNDYFRVWFYLLFNATHKSMEVIFDGQVIILKPGQLITGRKSIANICKIKSESKVQRILNTFQKNEKIEQQTCSKNRLITIKKWEDYQINEQQMNNKRTTNEQRVNTNNNVKKDNNNYSLNNITNIFEFVEMAFGRTLSSPEYELISTWEDNEVTRYAIRETVLNRVSNLKYTNSIIEFYKQNNIKSLDDIKSNERKYKHQDLDCDKQQFTELFDYDWLNEHE